MWRCSGALLCLLANLGSPAAQSIGQFRVEDPRPFGHFIGDTLQRRVTFDSAGTAELMLPDRAPQPRRVNPWVELQNVQAIRTHWAQGRRYQLALTYQIVNSPPQPTLITVPGMELQIRSEGETRIERLPDWLLLVAPLTGDDVRQGLEAHRPSRAPVLIDIRRTGILAAGFCGAGLLLTAWACFERWGAAWFQSRRGAFARARLHLQRLARERRGPAHTPRALRIMHRAFDETAGHRLFAEQVDEFLTQHPEFAGLHADIRNFFETSRAEFFGPGSASDVQLPALLQLSEQLRRRERRSPGSRAAVV